PITVTSSKPATTAGASRAAPTIKTQPALAPSPQPRPAPTARALPPELVAREGQNWTPITGQIWKPIDRWENSDAQDHLVCRCRRFDRDWLRTMGGLARQSACFPLDRSGD